MSALIYKVKSEISSTDNLLKVFFVKYFVKSTQYSLKTAGNS